MHETQQEVISLLHSLGYAPHDRATKLAALQSQLGNQKLSAPPSQLRQDVEQLRAKRHHVLYVLRKAIRLLEAEDAIASEEMAEVSAALGVEDHRQIRLNPEQKNQLKQIIVGVLKKTQKTEGLATFELVHAVTRQLPFEHGKTHVIAAVKALVREAKIAQIGRKKGVRYAQKG